MKVVICTSTGFHLRRLAVELLKVDIDCQYFSYAPRFRLNRDGITKHKSTSLFVPLLPRSAIAQFRYTPKLQSWAIPWMREATDNYVAAKLQECDIFIGLSSVAIRSAEIAKKEFGATVIIERGSRHVASQNELIIEGGGLPLDPQWMKREERSYATADYISVLSEHAADSFLDRGYARDKLFVNPLGVDLTTFRSTPRPRGSAKLLFVGPWSIQKGADLLNLVMGRHPTWNLTHVGIRGDVPLSTLPNVKHMGYHDHSALSQLMATHHVLVLPSRQDGFGMVLLEALASGLPIVATDMTGAPDIRDQLNSPSFIEICRTGDAGALDIALNRMIDREHSLPGDRKLLSDADRQWFSWNDYGRRYRQFLSKILSDRQ